MVDFVRSAKNAVDFIVYQKFQPFQQPEQNCQRNHNCFSGKSSFPGFSKTFVTLKATLIFLIQRKLFQTTRTLWAHRMFLLFLAVDGGPGGSCVAMMINHVLKRLEQKRQNINFPAKIKKLKSNVLQTKCKQCDSLHASAYNQS